MGKAAREFADFLAAAGQTDNRPLASDGVHLRDFHCVPDIGAAARHRRLQSVS